MHDTEAEFYVPNDTRQRVRRRRSWRVGLAVVVLGLTTWVANAQRAPGTGEDLSDEASPIRILPEAASGPSDAPVTLTGSYAPDAVEEDIGLTVRGDQIYRHISVSPHDPNVAYVTSWNGFVFKTIDGGRTWDESRLIIDRRPFFGDEGQALFFGQNRVPDPPAMKLSWGSKPDTGGKAGHLLNMGVQDTGGGGGGGGQGLSAALANANFGIGLPGSAPRLQQWFVRKLGKPTSGLNLKQMLLLRGTIEKEIRRVIVHPHDPRIVFACTHFGMFKSNDGGLSWVRVFAGSNVKENKVLYGAIDPLDTNRVLVGTEGGMFYSDDMGETFTKVGAAGVGDSDIDHVIFYPKDPRFVFAATHQGVLRSPDGGRNWDYIYYTTYIPARWVRHLAFDTFDTRRGYIGTFDGLFTAKDIITASFEDWERVAGLNFVGTQIRRVLSCPQHKGHLWVAQQIKLPAPNSPGLHDVGVTMLWESIDGGRNWKVIKSGDTYGSVMWFEPDLADPDMLWILWSRALTKLRRKGDTKVLTSTHEESLVAEEQILGDLPSVMEAEIAALRFAGVELGLMRDFRNRVKLRPFVPQVEASYAIWNTDGYGLLDDFIYSRSLPFRKQAYADQNFDEFRVMLNWDLSDFVFNLQQLFFGRIHRLNNHIRQLVIGSFFRNYGELKRLVTIMNTRPPEDMRIRVLYKTRIEELYALVDTLTGGYLTRYAKGDKPSGWDTPWFERWPGVTQDYIPQSNPDWTATGFKRKFYPKN